MKVSLAAAISILVLSVDASAISKRMVQPPGGKAVPSKLVLSDAKRAAYEAFLYDAQVRAGIDPLDLAIPQKWMKLERPDGSVQNFEYQLDVPKRRIAKGNNVATMSWPKSIPDMPLGFAARRCFDGIKDSQNNVKTINVVIVEDGNDKEIRCYDVSEPSSADDMTVVDEHAIHSLLYTISDDYDRWLKNTVKSEKAKADKSCCIQ